MLVRNRFLNLQILLTMMIMLNQYVQDDTFQKEEGEEVRTQLLTAFLEEYWQGKEEARVERCPNQLQAPYGVSKQGTSIPNNKMTAFSAPQRQQILQTPGKPEYYSRPFLGKGGYKKL